MSAQDNAVVWELQNQVRRLEQEVATAMQALNETERQLHRAEEREQKLKDRVAELHKRLDLDPALVVDRLRRGRKPLQPTKEQRKLIKQLWRADPTIERVVERLDAAGMPASRPTVTRWVAELGYYDKNKRNKQPKTEAKTES